MFKLDERKELQRIKCVSKSSLHIASCNGNFKLKNMINFFKIKLSIFFRHDLRGFLAPRGYIIGPPMRLAGLWESAGSGPVGPDTP